MAASACRRATSSLLGVEQALEDGKVDAVVHALLLALGDPLQLESRQKREQTLVQAFAKLETLLSKQKQLQPAPRSRAQLNPCVNDDNDNLPACLSYPQLQMFALHKLQPESSAYNIVRAVKVTRVPFDELALHWTLSALMAKHDVLRTVYNTDAYGEPRQRVLPLRHFVKCTPRGVCNSVVTVHRLEQGVLDDMMAWIAAQTALPFDMSRDAPVRVLAVPPPAAGGNDESATSPVLWTLVVVLHHIATDPTSSSLFWRDLAELYAQAQTQHAIINALATTPDVLTHLEQHRRVHHVEYRDFARWQRQRIDSGVLAPSLQFWIDALTSGSDGLSVLELPFDTDGAVASNNGASSDVVVFQSSPALHTSFAALCISHGCSLFIGLLAVFQLLLTRLAGCDDVVIGVPTAARSHESLEDVLGYFVNTLPFRITAPSQPDASFVDVLTHVRDVVLQGFAHMDVPLQLILDHVASALPQLRQQSAAPSGLYQVMFAWESSRVAPASDTASAPADPLGLEDIALSPGDAKFDLMLSMRARANHNGDIVLEGSMEYPTARFRRDTIRRFTEYFLTLLDRMTTRPDVPVRGLSMLPDAEQHTLLHEWGTPVTTSATAALSESESESAFLDTCLLDQVRKTPERAALRFEGDTWTYEQLWTAGERVCNALQALGVAPGEHVGLYLDRGLEHVAAIVGILQLRAVFVPLDTEFPPDRIAYMIRDSCVRVVVSQSHLAHKLSLLLERSGDDQDSADTSGGTIASGEVTLLLWVDIARTSARATMSPPGEDTRDNDAAHLRACGTIAYVLYTSGSTGRPKGVLVTHANLLTTLRWTVRQYAVSHDDVFLQSTSSTLDGSLTQLFSPLLVGGSAVITKKHGLHDLLYIRDVLMRERITFCVFVPSYFALLIDAIESFPPHVKHVVLAGEALSTALVTKFYAKYAVPCARTQTRTLPTCLVNEYGPTEASVTSTFFKLPCATALDPTASIASLQTVPIGKPIDDHYVAVLDAHKRLVPVNVPGELYVGGHGVASGYWRRPELTAASFSRLELLPKSNRAMRWYKTGDRVKWLASGELLFLGRTDAQVKLRGMRIELQEIRNVLVAHDAVQDAEVLVLEQQTALVGFVMLANQGALHRRCDAVAAVLAELQRWLRARLPVHMVPQALRVVDDWPRTPNGKLDTRALAHFTCVTSRASGQQCDALSRPGAALAQDSNTSLGVRIATDILVRAWAEALDFDHYDDRLLAASFFELGGTSLSAIRVMAIVKAHGLTLTLDAFFRCASLEAMAHVAAVSLSVVGARDAVIQQSSLQTQVLVPLNWKQQQHERASPLFLVHCADGTVWKLLELAHRLPFAVVGVQATGECRADSIEALAKQYWRAIRATQPIGPYTLGGYSFGCRVAHEIARLAHAEGHALAPLTLLDGVPCSLPLGLAKHATAAPVVSDPNQSDAFARAYVTQAYSAMDDASSRTIEQKQLAGQVSSSNGGTDNDLSSDDRDILDQLAAEFVANCALDAKYAPYEPRSAVSDVPASFSTALTSNGTVGTKRNTKPWLHVRLYKTAQWTLDTDEQQLYRDHLGIAIDVVDVPGTHVTLLQAPHVAQVADAIATQCLPQPC